MNVRDMFDTRTLDDAQEGSREWATALFRRAYMSGSGPFARVCDRLELGYSVLAYVPGNCMAAAASVARHQVPGFDWTEYLEHPSGSQTLEDVWRATPALLDRLVTFFARRSSAPPAAIFHNLDFLTDGRGGVYNHPLAQTALTALVSGTRQGVVLGLSDRDEPELPAGISRAFSERIRIDEIPYANFHRLMPVALGNKLSGWNELSEGAVWLMAARLRWTDPIQVNRILTHAHRDQTSLTGVFARILGATQTVNFERGDEVHVTHALTGVPEHVQETLESDIIQPFLRWKDFKGDREAYFTALQKLPPGAILYGPPGTGKTHLARWVALRIGLPVRTVSGGELRSSLYGETERNVRALFREARRAAPCVLILDDADDLLPARSKVQGSVASADRAVVNEFLQQLQGFRGRIEGVLVLLTTNRFSSLDTAARARLPVHIRVPYPLDEAQIGQILDREATAYRYELSSPVRKALVQRFMQSLGEAKATREKANGGYFSPREIQQAMRMLDPGRAEAGMPYAPTEDDVRRIERHYERSAVEEEPE